MSKRSQELPNCSYTKPPILITPNTPTPNHSLYLSNLDDQEIVRCQIEYVFLFEKSIESDLLKRSLSRVLVDYYPLAGRLKKSVEDDEKLEVDCNGEGAVFAEGFMDITAKDFLAFSDYPNKSWGKLLCKDFEARSFLDVPPLIVQITNLCCGGMIMCTSVSHCICDAIGTSQFLHAWANFTTNNIPNGHELITPFHSRHVLKPRAPPLIKTHPKYYKKTTLENVFDVVHVFDQYVQSHPLVLSSLTFTLSQILYLKKQCAPFLKCTTFEALASHTWRSWIKCLNLDPLTCVKLLFVIDFRKRIKPDLSRGYYGNAIVLGCAEAHVKDLVDATTMVEQVQQAKCNVNDEYVRSVVDTLEDKMVKIDLSGSLAISSWRNLGLEDLDFGKGKPLHMGPMESDTLCLFLPVARDNGATRVVVSMPENIVDKFEYFMTEFLQTEKKLSAD